MRNAFITTLETLAMQDENVYLLTGDLGFSVFEKFAKKFPNQYLNCGVAEQNMIGVAAGLALEGKKVYVYSIIPFLTMRCFEQVRNDLCYQNLNVKLIGAGAGLSYGHLGATHYAIEDIALLRGVPNITILSPADVAETEQLLQLSYEKPGPTYIRLARTRGVSLYESSPNIEIGKPSLVREGKDGVIIATGSMVEICGEVTSMLGEKGHEYKLLSMHTLKPVNKESILKEIGERNSVFSVEEHNILGGLGAVIAEILSESSWQGTFRRFGIPDIYPEKIGEAEFLRKQFQLDAPSLTKRILHELQSSLR